MMSNQYADVDIEDLVKGPLHRAATVLHPSERVRSPLEAHRRQNSRQGRPEMAQRTLRRRHERHGRKKCFGVL